MSDPTDADRTKARELALLVRSGVGGPALREDVLAQALADEREKARAPFLALADELEREGLHEEAQARRLGATTTAESWWGSSAATFDAATRIRKTT